MYVSMMKMQRKAYQNQAIITITGFYGIHVKPRKCNKPFDYYPMGRVEFSNKGKPIIYTNRNIGDEFIPEIMRQFCLTEIPRIHYDGSDHYKSHYDRE